MRARIGGVMVAALVWAGLWSGNAMAQDRAWVQVEAQPTLAEAETRARAYASAFPDVEGFRLGSRWFGIALGPYAPAEAQARLIELRGENLIPADSYITNGTNFRERFWPFDGAAPAPVAAPEPIAEAPLPADIPPPGMLSAESGPSTAGAAPALPDETPAEARRSEAALSVDDRMDLQRALQWAGFYTSGIDGAFGPGTRNSMAAWQGAQGHEETGVLSAGQRAALLDGWRADMAAFGFQPVTEGEAGIEIDLPLGLVRFDHYEPPFVHFAPQTEGGMRVILISQPGDSAALYGLYDVLQTLAIIPPEGARSRDEQSFRIEGRSATLESHAYAQMRQGLIKGYILVWSPAESEAAGRVLARMQESFRPVGSRALDPGMVPMTEASRRGLLAGLEVRRPRASASGFYVDAQGRVATLADAVAQCGRVTLDGVTEARVTRVDTATGLALLEPQSPLAPPAFATFRDTPDRLGTEVAVAGYSYGEALPAPALTFGTLEDLAGLNGEAGLKRLGITTLPGDAGGPVLDGSGAVLGMLLPRATGGERLLPEGVEFAAAAEVITASLAQAGLAVTAPPANGALAPEDLTRKAMGMTVLVGCWD